MGSDKDSKDIKEFKDLKTPIDNRILGYTSNKFRIKNKQHNGPILIMNQHIYRWHVKLELENKKK